MLRTETPGDTVVQLSGNLPGGQPMLVVLAKSTYKVDGNGRCRLADVQVPLVDEPQADPDDPALMIADSDLIPYKLRTDVVVAGHVHAGRRARRVEAVIRVGQREKRIVALGPRTVGLSPGGALTFSEPGPIERVPLSYKYAYGGRDRGAEALWGNPAEYFAAEAPVGCDIDQASPFLYPRNPSGRGYLIELTPEAVELLELPQLEDPTDLLTPGRLVVGAIDRWQHMPLPQATGWVDYGWYPRIAFGGIVPINERFDSPPLEVVRGLVPEYLADGTGAIVEASAFELMSGASLGLQVPYLRGGEAVELTNLHRAWPRWDFVVPRPPVLHTDGRNGRLNPTEVVAHTLLVEPDEDQVTIVWRGTAPALRHYAPDELERMPLRAEWR